MHTSGYTILGGSGKVWGQRAGEQWPAMSGEHAPIHVRGLVLVTWIGYGCSQPLIREELSPSIKPAKVPGPLDSCNLAESSRWWRGLPEPRRVQSLHRPAQGWWGHHLAYLGMGEVCLPVPVNAVFSL